MLKGSNWRANIEKAKASLIKVPRDAPRRKLFGELGNDKRRKVVEIFFYNVSNSDCDVALYRFRRFCLLAPQMSCLYARASAFLSAAWVTEWCAQLLAGIRYHRIVKIKRYLLFTSFMIHPFNDSLSLVKGQSFGNNRACMTLLYSLEFFSNFNCGIWSIKSQ